MLLKSIHGNYANLLQKAIDAIQYRRYGDVPMIISGPPGTGKTKTIVETVVQLCRDKNFSGSILVCAPSDQAADTLALRLKPNLTVESLLRLQDYSRTFAEVPEALLVHCVVDSENNIFTLPPFERLMRYKVVVTTCRDAHMLVEARVTNRDLNYLHTSLSEAIGAHMLTGAMPPPLPMHWTALFLDEAAQATEPEALVPLTVMIPPSEGCVQPVPMFVLAGDQHQLGPWVLNKTSPIATSLFERLFNRPLYAEHPLSRASMIASRHVAPSLPILYPPFSILVRNYRSHPAILAVPSSLFYDNTLISEAGSPLTGILTWLAHSKRRWPVLFRVNGGIDTCEDIQGVAAGWINWSEARIAVEMAQEFARSAQIPQKEICIIAPFAAQVKLVRELCRKSNMYSVNVGPMEAFQGLESEVVIICTTRARSRFVDADVQRNLGMIHAKKRFNVAVTRAKQALVVVGNPYVLKKDECWNTFLGYCVRNELVVHDRGQWDAAADGLELKRDEWMATVPTKVEVEGLEASLVWKMKVAEQVEEERTARKRTLGQRWLGGSSAEADLDAIWMSGVEIEERLREEEEQRFKEEEEQVRQEEVGEVVEEEEAEEEEQAEKPLDNEGKAVSEASDNRLLVRY